MGSKKGKHLCLGLMMKLFFFLILGISFSSISCTSLLLNEVCGPEECNIQCEDDQKCIQNLEINCITSPCCPQWSCGPAAAAGSAGACPDCEPAAAAGSAGECPDCEPAAAAGSAGECQDCEPAAGSAGECPDCEPAAGSAGECQDCKPAAGSAGECPDERPELGTTCEEELEGVTCDYGSQECCGEWYPEMTMECIGGSWQGYYIDTLCILGLAPPCPGDTTTLPPTTTEPEQNVHEVEERAVCPDTPPVPWTPCEDPGHHCPYNPEECCGEIVYDVIYLCVQPQYLWQPMFVDSKCDLGVPCDVKHGF